MQIQISVKTPWSDISNSKKTLAWEINISIRIHSQISGVIVRVGCRDKLKLRQKTQIKNREKKKHWRGQHLCFEERVESRFVEETPTQLFFSVSLRPKSCVVRVLKVELVTFSSLSLTTPSFLDS